MKFILNLKKYKFEIMLSSIIVVLASIGLALMILDQQFGTQQCKKIKDHYEYTRSWKSKWCYTNTIKGQPDANEMVQIG